MLPTEYAIGRYRHLKKEIPRLQAIQSKRGWKWVVRMALLFAAVKFAIDFGVEFFTNDFTLAQWLGQYKWTGLALTFVAWIAINWGTDIYDTKRSLNKVQKELLELQRNYPSIEEAAA